MNDILLICLLSIFLPLFIMALGANAQAIFDYLINVVALFGSWRDKFDPKE